MPGNNEDRQAQKLHEARQFWDNAAASFDDEPDHGLRDPLVLDAWRRHLAGWLPAPGATILDTGCGTGSLSCLLATMGHDVTGIDLSPAMIARAEAKALAAHQRVRFQVMDAADLQLSPQQFDVILCRHLLWTLAEPGLVLQRWIQLLAPGGRLLLIEGFWKTGVGLHATEVTTVLPRSLADVIVHELSGQPELWGGAVADERYAVVANLPAQAHG
jgi:2-polyprenyl-3-methyl-5-hydroxy-6-metoxy-1,4-benzoquinol methylase